MKDKDKTKGQLLKELSELRKQIVELEKSETERTQAEEKLRNLFNYTTDGIFGMDLDGVYTQVNQRLVEMHGLSSRDEMLGRNGFEFVAPQDIEGARAGMKKVLEQREVLRQEYTALKDDGTGFPVEVSGTLLRDTSGTPTGIIGIVRDITERKNVEEALRVKDSAIESSINAIAISDLGGILTYVNPSFLRLWGYEDAQEVLGKQNVEFWQHKEKAEDVVNALYDEGTWIGELAAKRRDGSLFDAQLSASVVKNENDEPICMMASFMDITERKKAEEELKNSEERLKILFEYAPDAYYLNDSKGTFLDGNKAAEKLIGYKREELVGKSFLKLKMLSPDQIPKAAGLLAKNTLRKSTGPDEFILNRKDGNQVPVEIRAIPVKIKGQLLVLGIARDITERKKSEEKLRESEEKFRNIVELSPDGIIIIDLKGVITTCNPAFLNLTGFSKKEIVGKHFTKLTTLRRRHVKDIPKYIKMFNTILRGEVPKPLEMTWLHKDGNARLGEFHVSLMKKDRKTIGIQVIARDITDRKKAEEELVIQNKYNELRAEIWEKASDPSLKEERDLIQVLLNTVGPAVDVSRATYLSFVSERKAYVTQLQWYKKEVGDSLGEDISSDAAKHFIGRNYIEIPKDIDKIIKIPGLRRTIILYVSAKLKKHNIKSYLVVPYGDINKPKGLFTFSECEKDKEWSDLEKNIFSEVVNIVTMKVEQIRAAERVKASLKEKDVLLQEIHHRVKNNMQIISSLIRLQSRHIHDEQALKMFMSTQNRVRSMAIIHERLYKSKDFAKVDFGEYIKILTSNLFSAYGINPRSVKLHLHVKDVSLDINTAIPCGLIVNELVSNSLKHAFPDGKKGEIKITMQPLNKTEVELIVSDNGTGLPEKVDFRNTESLGLHLVAILAEDQLRGNIKLDRKKGTSFHLRLGVR